MSVAIKVWVSMLFLGLLGGICGVEKEYAFWSASVDFHALFGLVGGVLRQTQPCRAVVWKSSAGKMYLEVSHASAV